MTDKAKEYKLLSIDDVKRMLNQAHLQIERMIVRERLVVNLDIIRAQAPQMILNMIRVPFCIDDNRLIRVLDGRLRIEINFTDYNLQAGDIILVQAGTYFEIKEVTEDTHIEAIAFVPQKYPTNLAYHNKSVIKIHPTPSDWDMTSHLLYTIYSVAKDEPYRSDVAEPLVQALVNLVIGLSAEETSIAASNAEHLFHRFVELIATNKQGKQPVGHYADLLCITPQYLSKIVTAMSGNTVSEWINKAVVLDARILLRDTTKTISEIADTLNFPNDSFFCRFFKRETGQTPTQYRREAGR